MFFKEYYLIFFFVMNIEFRPKGCVLLGNKYAILIYFDCFRYGVVEPIGSANVFLQK